MPVLIGGKFLNKHADQGASLLELMVVILLIAIFSMISMPLLQRQIAQREIDMVARQFIAHAHFARQQAMLLGQPVFLGPSTQFAWDGGWRIQSACLDKAVSSNCVPKYWFSQGAIEPIYFKGKGKQFVDPHSGKSGILFNAAGAARTGQGGFVANRLILGHRKAPDLERHLILSSGGRWRICNPATDAKRCH